MVIKKEQAQVLRPPSILSEAAVGTPTVKMRTNLYEYMYEIAKEHRDIAKQVKGKGLAEELKASMVSILFAYTCLEAYINRVGRDKLGSRWADLEGKKTSTEAKWIKVSKDLARKKAGKQTSVFSRKKEPFKSFRKLEEIREELIVHWKAEFGDIVDNKYGRMDAVVKKLSYETAKWSCNTLEQMVRKLNESIEEPPPDEWLD